LRTLGDFCAHWAIFAHIGRFLRTSDDLCHTDDFLDSGRSVTFKRQNQFSGKLF
jgi:hypothetical protein